MARLAIHGFEAGSTVATASDGQMAENGNILVGTSSIQSGIKRSGNYALRCNPATIDIGYAVMVSQIAADWTSTTNLTFALFTSYTRFYFYVATAPSSYEIAALTSPSKAIIYAKSSGAGFVLRVTDNGGTNYDNATILNLNQWYRIELFMTTAVGTATLTLYVDGVQWMNTSTADTSVNDLSYWALGKQANTNGQGVDFYYDDFTIDDSALPGAGSVIMLYPNAAGTDQTWTATGAATHPGCVDDWNRQNGDDLESTYLVVSASGTQAEENHCLDFTGNFSAQSISAVLAVLVQRNGGGTANVGTPRLRSGSTNSDGVAYDPGTTYTTRFKLFTTDPATGLAWTAGGLDAVQIGFVKTQSQARAMRMTASAVMVDYVPTVATTARSFGWIIG